MLDNKNFLIKAFYTVNNVKNYSWLLLHNAFVPHIYATRLSHQTDERSACSHYTHLILDRWLQRPSKNHSDPRNR